jgi:hypothetical protein
VQEAEDDLIEHRVVEENTETTITEEIEREETLFDEAETSGEIEKILTGTENADAVEELNVENNGDEEVKA